MAYFSGQGKLWIGLRDTQATPGPGKGLRWVGNVRDLQISLETTKVEHKESWSGQRLTDLSLVTERKSSISATLEDFSSDNLSLLFNGTTADVTGTAAIVGEVLIPISGSGGVLTVGNSYATKYQDLTAVTVRDGAAAVVANTKYTLNAQFGSLEFNSTVGAPTLPITIDYTRNTFKRTVMFNAGVQDYWVRFEGVNTANNNAPALVELYKVQWDPVTGFGIISDELNTFALNGNCLADSFRSADGEFGSFGRILDMA